MAINNYNDFLYEFRKANALKQGKMALEYPNYAKMFAQGAVGQVKSLADRVKPAQAPKQNVNNLYNNVKNMGQALKDEGLIKAPKISPQTASKLSTVGKIGKGLGTVGGMGLSLLDVPQTVANWNAPGSNALTRAYDVLGNIGTIGGTAALASGIAAPIGLAGIAGGIPLHSAAEKMRNQGELNTTLDANPLKELTPQQLQRVQEYERNMREAQVGTIDDLAADIQRQGKELADIENFYNNIDNRISNERLPVAPTTPPSIPYGVSNPNYNLTPINEPPVASNRNYNQEQVLNPQQNIGSNMQNDNLLNNINMISQIVGGAQQRNQLPNIGVTPEELAVYENALRTYGANLQGTQADIKAYNEAARRDDRVNMIAGLADTAGGVLDSLLPAQNMYNYTYGSPGLSGVAAPTQRDLSTIGTDAIKGRTPAVDRFAQQYTMNNELRKAQSEAAQQASNLSSALRVSQATGLPLNVTSAMKPENYINYLSPFQTGGNELALEGLKGINNLISDKEKNLTELATTQATNLANLEREQLSQMGQNQRANLNAQMDYMLNQYDNKTKIDAIKLAGYNNMQLEKLRQTDPIGYMRAKGNIVQAAALLGGNAAKRAGLLVDDLLNQVDTRPSTENSSITSYWQNLLKE